MLHLAYVAHRAAPPALGEESVRKTVERFQARHPEVLTSDGNVNFDSLAAALGLFLVFQAIAEYLHPKAPALALKAAAPDANAP